MKDKIAEYVKGLFARKRISGFLALRREGEDIAPHLFTSPDELDSLNLGDRDAPGDSRQPLVKIAARLHRRSPQETLAVLVRGCDERALKRLFNDDRVTPLDPRRLIPVGFACPAELAQACACARPWPQALVAGEKAEPAPPPEPPADLDLTAELDEWFNTFDRCLKCFGCRNVCPVCSCLECTMEEEALIPQRELPVSRDFLMTKALHMTDRCVYCGLCEAACPAGIPLKSLFRLTARMTGTAGVGPAPAGFDEAAGQ